MNVRTLCLAILDAGDATGYEIKKLSVEGKYSYFVDASFGSIYPALARLESEGLVTVREEAQSGKPARKIYSITETGRRELVRQLAAPPGPDIFRSEFLLVAMCAELLPRGVLSEAIERRIVDLSETLAHLDHIARTSENAGARWIAGYGRVCTAASLDYLETHRHALEALAKDAGESRSRDAAE